MYAQSSTRISISSIILSHPSPPQEALIGKLWNVQSTGKRGHQHVNGVKERGRMCSDEQESEEGAIPLGREGTNM